MIFNQVLDLMKIQAYAICVSEGLQSPSTHNINVKGLSARG